MKSVACLLLVGLALSLPSPASARRYLVALGQNAGAGDDLPLRFAERDAERVAEVMLTVGGVDEGDATLLFGADAERLVEALEAASRRLRAAGDAPFDQLVVYVSGHAADGMLHLDGTRYPIAALRDFVERAPVGLAMLVLDTCDAGRLTRRKGLAPLPGPAVRVERPDAEGRIYIAASAVGEAAYESDRLEGALFTHHLTTGLRGAADRDGDGRVTLDEAFGYAYVGTRASTFGSRRRQTPSYAVDLRGEGAVVLTETGRAAARLTLDDGRPGEWTMLATATGEGLRLSKGAAPLVLAVAPGRWRARTTRDGRPVEARVEVPAGGEATVRAEALRPTASDALATRGSGRRWSVALAAELAPSAVDGGAGAAATGGGLTLRRVGLDGWAAADLGVRVSAAADVSQVEYTAGLAGGRVWWFDRAAARAGLRAEAAAVHQRGVPGGARWSVVPRAGAEVGLDWPVLEQWSVIAEVRGGAQLVRRVDGWRIGPHAVGRLGVAWRL